MEITSEDLEYQEALNAKRHKELLGSLKKIADALSKTKDPSKEEIRSIVDSNKKVITAVIQKLDEIKQLPAPEVIVENNQDAMVKEFVRLRKLITKVLNQEPPEKEADNSEWTFDVKRDTFGFIESVTARKN